MGAHLRRPGPTVFAVDRDAIQVTWSRLSPDVARVQVGDVAAALTPGDGPGSVVVTGLPAGSLLDVRLETARGADRGGVPAHTLSPPPGPELFRFATISDLHLGERRFGYLSTIGEHPEPDEPYSVRAAEAAIEEIAAWGGQLLVVKGDITVDSMAHDWERFGRMLGASGLPTIATAGNHDRVTHDGEPGWRQRIIGESPRGRGSEVTAEEGLHLAGLDLAGPVQVRDVPGLRIVLADTTVPGHRSGQIESITDDIVEALATAPGAAFVALHHQLMTTSFPTYIPVGIRGDESRAFLDRAVAANPALLVTSGHTHRHRRRRHGTAVVTEVGSPKDFPGSWAGYVVHEGGIRQVVRRIARPDVLRWTDRSADAALGLWGHWSPGALDDRCFAHTWPTR